RIRGTQVKRARDGVEAELAWAGQAAQLEQGDIAVRDAGGFGQSALAPALGVAEASDAPAEGRWIEVHAGCGASPRSGAAPAPLAQSTVRHWACRLQY